MGENNIGILHPGAMGISVAASLQNGSHNVYWTSDSRSLQTQERAAKHDLVDAGNLQSLCENCSIILSVCPPHAAEDVANQVLEHSFDGIYLDANAISPERAKRIGQALSDAGANFVDGGIIGGPAWEAGKTWLYLSGPESHNVAQLFSAGPLETGIINDKIGSASALKMCFAAFTKGSTALLCAVMAAADSLDVRRELENHWSLNRSGFDEEAKKRVTGVTAKAWRFAGEMDEIAATFSKAGVPSGFHEAAAEIYSRLANYKDFDGRPGLDEVLADLLRESK
jgi:3-hydroxyisobutyrate dehydrogenase-like beta-hydroxyacid dehydrogenase